jgi:hypothetical protein
MIGSRFARLALASGFMALVACACGGAAERAGMPESKSPGDAPRSPEPTTIEEAEQQIAAARAELAGSNDASRFAQEPSAPAPPPPPPAAESSTSPSSPTSRPSHPPRASKATQNTDDRCASPCRALASMRRAVTALCRMTGNDDARCVDAKRTLTDSQARIAPCSC